MLGKKKQPGDVGHIRPSTQGTSNEISFSVLHAKSNAAAQDQGSPLRPAWELPQEELHARRTRRRRGRRLIVAAMVLAAVGVVAVVTSLVVVNVQRQLDHVANMKWTLQQVIDECDQLRGFNDAVSQALVQTMGSTPAADMEKTYNAYSGQLPGRIEHLRELKGQIESLQQQLQLPADKEAANQGISAVNAQLNLIDMSRADMEFALPAQQAYADAQQAMEDILRADGLAREATDIMADMNAETAAQSKAKSEECLAALREARTALLSAQEEVQKLVGGSDGSNAESADEQSTAEQGAEDDAVEEPTAEGEQPTEQSAADDQPEKRPEAGAPATEGSPAGTTAENASSAGEAATADPQQADTSNATDPTPHDSAAPDATIALYLEYTDLRIRAQEAAITSMQAYIDRDKATLQQANDTYNQLEAQAVQLIAGQTLVPSADVAAAFNAARPPYSDQWSAEAARASVALTAVRDYLS